MRLLTGSTANKAPTIRCASARNFPSQRRLPFAVSKISTFCSAGPFSNNAETSRLGGVRRIDAVRWDDNARPELVELLSLSRFFKTLYGLSSMGSARTWKNDDSCDELGWFPTRLSDANPRESNRSSRPPLNDLEEVLPSWIVHQLVRLPARAHPILTV